MSTSIKFLGVAAFEITGPNCRILIDPYLTGNPRLLIRPSDLETPDVILVSHAALDHLGDAVEVALRTGAPVVCGAEVRALLLEHGIPEMQVRATTWGIVVKVNGVVIRPVECHHWSLAHLPSGNTVTGVPMGFIVEPEPDVRIYHYGDTAIFAGLRLIGELYRPTIGLFGCTQPFMLVAPGAGEVLTGEMSPREAALAAELLGVELAVACHYLDLSDEQSTEFRDVEEFLGAVKELDSSGKRRAIAPRLCETIVVDGGSYRLAPALLEESA